MSRNVCCVPECPVVAGDSVPLHYFPCPEKDTVRFQDWVKIIGSAIASLDSTTIHKNRRICRRHFQKEFLYPKNRLSKLAVPSLLSTSVDVSGDNSDHNYCTKEDFKEMAEDDLVIAQGIDSDQNLLFDYFGSDHIQPKPSFMAERYRFRQRKQNADETIMQYISELENMSTFCDFNTVLEENLRDQLVCGLRSEQIRQRLFAEEILDYAKAAKIACAMEAAATIAGVVEQTLGSDGEPGDGQVATRVVRGDSEGGRSSATDSRNNCPVCGSADHWGEGCGQSRFTCGICKQKGHLNRVCPMRPGGRHRQQQQGRSDTDNMGSRQLQSRRETDNMGSTQLQGRCETDNMGSRQLQGRCETDNMGSTQLQGRCETDNKGAHVPVASGVTGQLDLVYQLGEDKPPSSDKENWEIEEDLQQCSRKGYKRLVLWVDEAQLPMDIDMDSFVSCVTLGKHDKR